VVRQAVEAAASCRGPEQHVEEAHRHRVAMAEQECGRGGRMVQGGLVGLVAQWLDREVGGKAAADAGR
jgi:hypothetical protein